MSWLLWLMACSDPRPADGPGAAVGGGPGGGASALDQNALLTASDAIVLSGALVVEGFDGGRLQVDVHTPDADRSKGDPPLTLAHFDAPGPFSLRLPAGTSAVKLSLVWDKRGDGPDGGDPTVDYPGNPVSLTPPPTDLVLTLAAAAERPGL